MAFVLEDMVLLGEVLTAHVKFFGKSAVCVEVFLILRAERDERWVIGEPVCQVILGEHGEVAALGCGVPDEGYGSCMVRFDGKRL